MSALRDAYERRLARQLQSSRMSTMERCTQRERVAERASATRERRVPTTKTTKLVHRQTHAELPWVRAEVRGSYALRPLHPRV